MFRCKDCKELFQRSGFYTFTYKKTGKKSRSTRCRQCDLRRVEKWKNENRDKYNEKSRKWHNTPKGRLSARNTRLRKEYDISQSDYEAMLKAQGGKCGICGEKSKYALEIDHDHKTGRVRELLCRVCNCVLGYVEKHSSRIRLCPEYLRKHNGENIELSAVRASVGNEKAITESSSLFKVPDSLLGQTKNA